MKFSKKSRYGLTSLIDLSVHSQNGHVALNSIAERNDISPQYLEDTAEESDCKGIAAAIQTRVIDEVNRQLDQILINLTLADLVKEYQEFEKYDESMYYI